MIMLLAVDGPGKYVTAYPPVVDDSQSDEGLWICTKVHGNLGSWSESES